MKLWLDDLRTAPEGWVHARTAEEAINHLKTGQVEMASFDHDLGYNPDLTETTGYDVCKWMAENNVWPKMKPNVHSANPVGKANMQGVIDRYGPYDKEEV